MAGTYWIRRDGRTVGEPRLFESDAEIRGFVGTQPPGDYEVNKVLDRDPSGTVNSQPWLWLRKLENGEVIELPEVEGEMAG